MDEFIKLMDEFWILKENDRENYYKIKRALDSDMRDFFHKFPDWRVVINNKLIKLEKIPANAKPFMGIESFEIPEDYCLLCAVLIYLDDKAEGEQFLLTELIENVERIVSDTVKIDFTRYSDRKSLVRVLRFAQEKDLLRISEGSLENAANDKNTEILYENTGYSVYFSVHQDEDVSEIKNYRDFEDYNPADSDKNSRVYRRLLLQPAVYWESSSDPEGIYLKKYRNSISKYLEKYTESRLDIHNGSAFCLFSGEKKYGSLFPSDKMLSGIVALICGNLIRSKKRTFKSRMEFDEFILKCVDEYRAGFSKEYREMSEEKLLSQVFGYMKDWQMIEERNECIIVLDGALLSYGKYPSDFKNKAEEK